VSEHLDRLRSRIETRHLVRETPSTDADSYHSLDAGKSAKWSDR